MKSLHWVLSATLCCVLPSHAQFILKEANLQDWNASHHKGKTDYQRTMDLEQGVVIRAVSKQASSSFTYQQHINLEKTPQLQWQWTVEKFPHRTRINEAGIEVIDETFDEATEKDHDFAVRLTLGRHSLWGEKTLSYVWSRNKSSGERWAMTEDRYVIVVNGIESSPLGWQTVRRDMAEDWQKAFGEKIDSLDFIAITTDADNTLSEAIGYYGDVLLVPSDAVVSQ